jgi:alcohol dehydrogenase class IV
VITSFSISRLPQIVFGEGSIDQVPDLASTFGKRALLVTGTSSLEDSRCWQPFLKALRERFFSWEHIRVTGEPSPQLVDEHVQTLKGMGLAVVIGIGGGSVLDAAKAIAGLLPHGNSVLDHLEGVGLEIAYQGPSVPFIAVPTTAGTGTEATKNAVLSVRGPNGFKKSFRNELLVAQYAVVDPNLLFTCPRPLIAADGMDALTQLIESFVSTKANPFTDGLALSGVASVRESLWPWYEEAEAAPRGRTGMAYAALISGITLAQAGLGAVHGLASPLGAYFPVPHGIVCGTLLAVSTEVNIRALRQRVSQSPTLAKYAQLGRVFSGKPELGSEAAWEALVETLWEWTERLDLPRLGNFGLGEADLERVVANCRAGSMKTNPLVLCDEELTEILRRRI